MVRAPLARAANEGPVSDGTWELKWDNGTASWVMSWYTGLGSWVGNDFDMTGYTFIEKVKFMSGAAWPNGQWDGFRVGVFEFFGGVPGSLWRDPVFVKGSGAGYRWCEFYVQWQVPGNRSVVAMEQYYNYPNCDPYLLDSNVTFRGHSWQYYAGRWSLLNGYQGYRNLMLRVIVSDLIAVTPTSLGRVKALFR